MFDKKTDFKTKLENIKPLIFSQYNIRIAPSPTGKLHIGNLYTFLWNMVAKKVYNAKLLLRIDDTDTKRSNLDYIQNIYDTLQKYNIEYDAVIQQSKRAFIYKDVINDMLEHKMLYYCQCDNQNEEQNYNACTQNCFNQSLECGVLRIKINPKLIECSINDNIRGVVTQNCIFHDIILVRKDGECLYHLASCIDDFFCSINTIIRSVEWLNMSFFHKYIFNCLNIIYRQTYNPNFIHLPIILGPDKKKLSKRRSSISMEELEIKFLPESIINYVLYISRKMQKEDIFQEIFNIKQITDLNIRTSQPIFDIKKLQWFNRKYIKNTLNETLLKFIHIDDEDIIPILFIKYNKHSFNLLDDWKLMVQNKNYQITSQDIIDYDIAVIEKFKIFIDNFYESLYHEEEFIQLFRQHIDKDPKYIHQFRFLIIKTTKGMSIQSLVKSFTKEYLINCLNNAIELCSHNIIK